MLPGAVELSKASTLSPSDMEALRQEFESLKATQKNSTLTSFGTNPSVEAESIESDSSRQDFVNLDSFFDEEPRIDTKSIKRSRK